MSKPAKTEAELIAMARAELKAHVDSPDSFAILIVRHGDSWKFRAAADQATWDKPGFPESVAMLVQIGDHLSEQYDLKGQGRVLRPSIAVLRRAGSGKLSQNADEPFQIFSANIGTEIAMYEPIALF